MRLKRAALLATLLLPLAFACSGGDVTGGINNGGNTGGQTGTTVTQNIELPNPFLGTAASPTGEHAAFAMLIEIRRIRITVYNAATNAVLFQKTYDVDPTQSKWTLPFEAPLGVQIKLVSELMSLTNGVEVVERSGQTTTTLQPCSATCTPIPIQTYPGPVGNLGATSVTLSSRTLSIAEGQTSPLSATVQPAGTYVQVWSSLNPTIATVSSNGLVTALLPGVARIVVAVGPRADTATVTVSGVAKSITVSAGNNQTAVVGSNVAIAPSVVVRDGGNNPLAGVAVTFEVATGGGTLTGATQTTNSSGVATLGSWKLGTTVGTQTLTARAGNLSTTITATATGAASTCANIAYTIGSTVNGTWSATDCLASSGSGRHYDMYAFTLTQQTAFKVSLNGPNGRRISTRISGSGYVQVMPSEAFLPSTSNPLELMYVFAPGSYVFEVASPDTTLNQTYTLTTTVDASTPCTPVTFITTGVTISSTLTAGDCASPGGSGTEDRFILLPDSGQRLDLNLTNTAFPPALYFRDDRLGPASPTLAFDRRSTAGLPVHVGYTTTFSGFTEVIVSGGTGAYTLSVGTASASNTCVGTNPMAIGGSTMAVWETSDCAGAGRVWDRYPFTVTSQTALRVTMSGNANDKAAGVFTPAGVEVLDWSTTAANDVNAVWFLAPGSYDLRSSAPAAAAGTAYTMTTSAGSTSIGCSNNGATSGVSFAGQSLASGDCTFNSRFEDRIVVYAQAGRTISITMSSSDGGPSVIIRDPASAPGTVIRLQSSNTAGTVSTSYVAPTTGYYQLIFSTAAQNTALTYSGSISF